MLKKKYLEFTLLCCLLACNFGVTRCNAQVLPIKPARVITFTTQEGSYMNVDVSPDGKNLLFDLLGNIYLLPAEGGKARQLTSGLALHLRPIWAPDGRKFAYISDASGDYRVHVYYMETGTDQILGASGAQVPYGSNPVWSNDCNYLTVKGICYSLFGGARKLTGFDQPVMFSKNSELEYFTEAGHLYRKNNLTDVKTALAPKIHLEYGGTKFMGLSPDGKWLLYTSSEGTEFKLLAHNLETNVVKALVPELLENKKIYRPSVPQAHCGFSPDSKYVYLGKSGKIHRISLQDGEDRIIPFNAEVKIDLGTLVKNQFSISQKPGFVRYIRDSNVSPDGKRLVFSALNKVYTMSLPGGKPNVLVNQDLSQFQPRFSPDGTWVTYVSWRDSVGGALWRVPAQGGHPELLTKEQAGYRNPLWSPDGKAIVVVKGSNDLKPLQSQGSASLVLIDLKTRFERILDKKVPQWNYISFSKDGSQIFCAAFSKEGEGGIEPSKILFRRINDTVTRTFSIGSPIASHPFCEQKTVSPDGRFIVYTMGEDLYLIPAQIPGPTYIYDKKRPLGVIRFASGMDPVWNKDGKMLSWTYGNSYYQVSPDTILNTAIRSKQLKKIASVNDSSIFAVHIRPRVIPIELIKTTPGHELIALKNSRIITMDGESRVLNDGIILIENGRISQVGTATDVSIPQNAKIMDLKGTTIIPGLVDLHLHLSTPNDLFPQQSWKHAINLAYGVTTARDPSTSFEAFGAEEAISAGIAKGPRLFNSGRAIPQSWGIRCENLEDAVSIAKKRKMLGGTFLKQYGLPTRIQRQWLLMACEQEGLNLTNEGGHDPIEVIGMIKDGSTGVEHNPEWGDVYNDIATLVAKSETVITPTLQVCYGLEEARTYFDYKFWQGQNAKLDHFTTDRDKLEYIKTVKPSDTVNPAFLEASRITRRFYEQGGLIGMGSHGNDQGIGSHSEIWALQMGGFSNMEALRIATIGGARAIGVQNDIGSIEAGKIADLIILNRNPLDDIHNTREIRYVMKDGVLYQGETLDIVAP